MATEFIRQQPLIGGFNPSRILGWLRTASGKLLSNKKYLTIGVGSVVLLAAAAYYFWGGSTSAAQYLTARVDRGKIGRAHV